MMSSRAWRIIARAVLAMGCLLTVLCMALFGAALRNDEAISEHLGHATAEVLAVKFDRTIIRYTTPDGEVHTPANGVLYPAGLRAGQLVRIEYDTTNPELARVAGRTAMLTILPLTSVILSVWVLAGPLLWWATHRERAEIFLEGSDAPEPGVPRFTVLGLSRAR